MTFPLRRKRPIISPATALTWISLLALAAPVAAQWETPPRGESTRGGTMDPAVERAIHQARDRSHRILQVQAPVPERIRLKQGSGLPQPDDDYYFKVQTKPPTRKQLFTLRSEDQLLENVEDEFKEQDPSQIFLMPAPIDRFDGPNISNLGPIWFQNRKTGKMPPMEEGSERRGEMRIVDQKGSFPVGSKPEAAILSESTGSRDMISSLHIDLANPQNKFGLVFRAKDPNTWYEDVDQLTANSFYYAVVTANTVTFGKMVEGKDTVLKTAAIDPATEFTLSIMTFGDKITVLRNDRVILEATDSSLDGEYVGILGLQSAGKPVTFWNFFALRYGGPYSARQFATSWSIFRGPNVHYHPLYFEQLTLERYGQHLGNLFQPFIAAGSFYADVFLLPYSLGKSPPWVCHSGICFCKPGDVVLPFKVYPPIWDKHGVGLETTLLVLSFSLIP